MTNDVVTHTYRAIDLRQKAGLIAEQWSPRVVVVPKGVEHKPYAAREVTMLLIEPRGVTNTGSAGGERTAQNDLWI